MIEEMGSAYSAARSFTMTSTERMFALWNAAKYVCRARIPGAFVECGVWRGGSAMLCAHAFLEEEDTSRDLYLFDTFEGMPEPTARDRDFRGRLARTKWKSLVRSQGSDWCYSPIEEVRSNIQNTRYPLERIRLVQGRVEDTIPCSAPEQISILRLDTDFYESTLHELQHLFSRVATGGVLIIDDYGHWRGAKDATDEYFASSESKPLLTRIDYTARLAIRTDISRTQSY